MNLLIIVCIFSNNITVFRFRPLLSARCSLNLRSPLAARIQATPLAEAYHIEREPWRPHKVFCAIHVDARNVMDLGHKLYTGWNSTLPIRTRCHINRAPIGEFSSAISNFKILLCKRYFVGRKWCFLSAMFKCEHVYYTPHISSYIFAEYGESERRNIQHKWRQTDIGLIRHIIKIHTIKVVRHT